MWFLKLLGIIWTISIHFLPILVDTGIQIWNGVTINQMPAFVKNGEWNFVEIETLRLQKENLNLTRDTTAWLEGEETEDAQAIVSSKLHDSQGNTSLLQDQSSSFSQFFLSRLCFRICMFIKLILKSKHLLHILHKCKW